MLGKIGVFQTVCCFANGRLFESFQSIVINEHLAIYSQTWVHLKGPFLKRIVSNDLVVSALMKLLKTEDL